MRDIYINWMKILVKKNKKTPSQNQLMTSNLVKFKHCLWYFCYQNKTIPQ